MKLTSQQYAQALYEAVQETSPNDLDKVMDNFVKILAQNGDLSKHAEIEAEFKRLDMKAKGIADVEVTVTREMEINKTIIDELNSVVSNTVSKTTKTEIRQKFDESIIGGIVVRVDDTLIDASVKGQLENLSKELKS